MGHTKLSREIRVFIAMLEFSDTLDSAIKKLRRIPECSSDQRKIPN